MQYYTFCHVLACVFRLSCVSSFMSVLFSTAVIRPFLCLFVSIAPPAPPKFCVNGTKRSTHSIKYSFQLGYDGQSPITEVTVSCYKVKSDNALDTSVEYKQTTSEFNSPNCTISEVFGLIPGTEYGCMLRARNGVDLSDPSDRFDQTTVTAGE